jgi:hypothetical protein
MLAEVCAYIHNYFLKKEKMRVVYYQRTYTISGGMLSLDFMKEGQRFLLTGSDLNDGVYTYHTNGIMNDDENNSAYLQDEVFSGTICPMAVPKELIDLCGEISEWNARNAAALNSPFQSESFNGYSYTLKSDLSGEAGSNDPPWAAQFAAQLEKWRKPYL